MNPKKLIQSQIEASTKAIERCHGLSLQMEQAAKILAQSFVKNGKVLLAGNGGSAADAKHIAGEFLSLLRTTLPRKALPAIAIPTDVPMLTASANDFDFVQTMARCVDAFGRKGDVFWAMSTSGTSKNVLAAVKVAQARGMKIVAFTGKNQSPLWDVADVYFAVESADTPIIQQCHMVMAHIICELVDHMLPAREYVPEVKDNYAKTSFHDVLSDIREQ